MKGIVTIVALFGLAPLTLALMPGSTSASDRNMVRELSPMNSTRAAHTATALNDGQVLIVGGFRREEGQIAGVELFDAEKQQFHAIDNAITPRQSHTATLLPNGNVLIAGGYSAKGGNLDTAEIFDPVTRRFSPAGRMKTPRADHTAVPLSDGRVVLIGGLSTDWTFLDSIEIYDPSTDGFSEAARMSIPRTGHLSVLLRDGRILIAGGYTGRRSNTRVYNTSEIFNPLTGRSTPAANMRTARGKFDGVLLADGRVLITGGSDGQVDRVDSAEIFDPARNVFSSVATMKQPHYKHRGSSLLLPNGKVLIAGGATQPELYDPTSDTFVLVHSESRLHGSFSAVTLLRDNRILITGGYFNPVAPSNGAWLYKF